MIVGVAIKHRETGKVFAMSRPARHDGLINALRKRKQFDHAKGDQGFVTDEGIFLDRERAMLHAVASAQPFVTNPRGSILFSEDLW